MKIVYFSFFALLVVSPCYANDRTAGYLVPITQTNVSGANGSFWVTELYAHNHSDEILWITNNFICQLPAVHACDMMISPRSTIRLPTQLASPVADPYIFYGVIEGDLTAVSFSSFIRNTSPGVESWGTAIPVPNLAEFRSLPLRISPVPVDLDYRVSLRVYTYPEKVSSIEVEIWELEDAGLREGMHLGSFSVVAAPEDYYRRLGSSFEVHHLLSKIPGLSASARLAIKVTSPTAPLTSRWWGFASVTHNVSQHVAIFTP